MQIHITDIERRHLADAQAGAVEQLDQGAVAQQLLVGSGGALRHLHQRNAVVHREGAWQALGHTRPRNARGRVQRADALPHEIAEEGAERGELAPERRRMAPRVQVGQEVPHAHRADSLGRICAAGEARELPHVAEIRAPGVR
jgi:hypothetical protein